VRKPLYQSDDEWRTVVIMNLVHLRQAIYEVGVTIGIIAVGVAANSWWDGAFIGASVIAAVAGFASAYQARRDLSRLTNLHFAADE
jgi:hypothetical protein